MDITFTVDLEDPTERYAPDGRYVPMTRHILKICAEHECRATFFTIGKLAEAAPQLIREIADAGHEIAYHSRAHRSLTEEEPIRFGRECREDKDRLEQLSGKPVLGFRAPRFSLTPQSRWALDVLVENNFRYSSSLMPTSVSLFGFADAPTTPFRWPNGLIELPLPVTRIAKWRIPYLGGIYLYALPTHLAQYWAHGTNDEDVLWTYTHPYDFDTSERFAPMPHTPLWVSMVLWSARRLAEKKVRSIMSLGCAAPLGERATALGQLPIFKG